MQNGWRSLGATLLVGGALVWASCGGGDSHGTITTFSGNVIGVTPGAVANAAPKQSRFALHWPSLTATAHAQSSCAAPSGGTLDFCIAASGFILCKPVESDCTFSIETALLEEQIPVTLAFLDDANGNLVRDGAEAASAVPHNLLFCNGDKVLIANAIVNFTSGLTAASVTKTEDRCSGATATATPGGTVTPAGTPAPTATPGAGGTPSPTPTYIATSVNRPPSSTLAFLFSAGVVGLLIPRRRRPK